MWAEQSCGRAGWGRDLLRVVYTNIWALGIMVLGHSTDYQARNIPLHEGTPGTAYYITVNYIHMSALFVEFHLSWNFRLSVPIYTDGEMTGENSLPIWTGDRVIGGTHTWTDRSSVEYLRDEVVFPQVRWWVSRVGSGHCGDMAYL